MWSQTVFTRRREQDGAQVRAPRHNAGVSAGKAHHSQAVARDILKQSSQRNKNVMEEHLGKVQKKRNEDNIYFRRNICYSTAVKPGHLC